MPGGTNQPVTQDDIERFKYVKDSNLPKIGGRKRNRKTKRRIYARQKSRRMNKTRYGC